MNQPEKINAWVTIYDKYGDADGVLAGNKEGLEKLKEIIDQAIRDGDASIEPEIEGDFVEVRCEIVSPHLAEKEETKTDKAIKYGCITLLVLSVVIFGFGLKGIYYALFTS